MTMFNKTLLGSAVLAAMMATSANAAIPLAGDAVQVYGQAAGFMTIYDDGDKTTISTTIESRIGFKGVVEFEDFGPNLIWQIEGGNADNGGFNPNEGWNHANNGQLGARDTFLGLQFDGVGQFTFGRQLVAAYNYVDWPHTNPGLGNVFDWNNDLGVTFEDRANNNLRFDSATFGGFNFQATLSGMSTTTDAMVASVAGSYSQDLFSVHAGYYTRGEYETGTGTTATTNYANNYAIVGGSMFLGDVTLTAAYKMMEADTATGSNGQDALSATAAYMLNNQWVFKAGYAMTTESDDGVDDDDLALTARLGYLLPSTYLYIDSRNYKMNNNDWTNAILVGAEYYF